MTQFTIIHHRPIRRILRGWGWRFFRCWGAHVGVLVYALVSSVGASALARATEREFLFFSAHVQ